MVGGGGAAAVGGGVGGVRGLRVRSRRVRRVVVAVQRLQSRRHVGGGGCVKGHVGGPLGVTAAAGAGDVRVEVAVDDKGGTANGVAEVSAQM